MNIHHHGASQETRRRHGGAASALVLAFVLAGLAGCTTGGRPGADRPPPPPGLFDEPHGTAPRGPDRSDEAIALADRKDAAQRLEKAEIYPAEGTGRLAPRAGTTRVEPAAGGISLNFVDAPVRDVVEAVLGETLKENYLIDPGVDARITARSARPIPRDRLVIVLEDVLAMHGLALVEGEEGYRIVPLDKAASLRPAVAELTALGPDTAGFGLHLIPLRFASAAILRQTLAPLVAPGRALAADDARNLLLFRGPGSEARDLMALVDLFDVDWLAGMSYGLLPLKSADVGAVIPELEAVFGMDSGTGGATGVRFLPIERMNAVLVIAADPALVDKAKLWVERLDRGEGVAGQRQLYVYHLKNARAEEVAEVLSGLFDVRLSGEEGGFGGGFGDVAPGRRSAEAFGFSTGAAGVGGSGASRSTGARSAARSSGTSASGSPSRTASGARPPGVTGARRSSGRGAFGATGFGGAHGFGGAADAPFAGRGPRIIADGRNDALLVFATPQEYRMVERTVKRLDIPPLQVLIEATIAEVSLNDQLRYGLRWFFQNQGAAGRRSNTLGFSDAQNDTVGQQFPGFSYLFAGRSARVALSALGEITRVNVVSSPQLMVLDNGTARLQVGDQVPVPSRQAVSTIDPNAPIVNSIDFKDTGVILEVTPHVNASGMVVLDIRQEVSDVVPTTTSGIDAPTIQKRVIESTVAVQTGETIALGGLIKDSRKRGRTGIPVLMSLPLVGNLFRTNTTTTDRTELLVLLTPKVVRDPAEARAVTSELRRRLYGLDALRRQFADEGGAQEKEQEAAGKADGGR